MKIKYIFLLFILLLHCSNQPQIPGRDSLPGLTDCEKAGLKGLVKQWIRHSYRISGPPDAAEKILISREFYRFNEAGMKLEVRGFNEKGKRITRGLTTYNTTGKVRSERYYGPGEEVLTAIEYEYDGEGHKIREIKNDYTGSFIYSSLWEYNDPGYMIEYKKYIGGGSQRGMLSHVKKKYTKNGSLLEERKTEYASSGDIHFSTVIRYNGAGQIKQIIEYDGKGEILEKNNYTYNKRGQLSTLVETRKDHETKETLTITSTYTYSKNGRLMKSSEPGRTVEYIYNEKSSPSEITEYTGTGKPVGRTITLYDDKNIKTGEERIYYTQEGRVDKKYVFNYNPAGLQTQWAKFDSNENLLYTYPTLYDDAGNKIEEVEEGRGDLPHIKYRYAYDKQGNHTETQCYQLDSRDEERLVMMYEYEIVYRE